MRNVHPLLLLIAVLMLGAAAIIAGFDSTPDINTVLGLGFGGLAVWSAAELLGDRP